MNQSLEFSRRLAVAPMLDWTDRHCRYFHRLLSKQVLLYTEMVNVNAIVHGDRSRHLDFDAHEHPLVLQLGGSDPILMAQSARIAQDWGYDELNINCGCPSERVQSGSFGACLMREPKLVGDCVAAIKDAVDIEVSVKHRIGLDRIEDYAFVRDFVGTVAQYGVRVFVVHARNAWLKGLSPRENRDVPPLRYEMVHQLKREFPHLHITLNGGVVDYAGVEQALQHVDGVMVGRWFYHDPYALVQANQRVYAPRLHGAHPTPTREEILHQLVEYAQKQVSQGVPLRNMVRHWLNLFHGVPGARKWRAQLSNAALLRLNDPTLLLQNVPVDVDSDSDDGQSQQASDQIRD